jgi:hypothetical protein
VPVFVGVTVALAAGDVIAIVGRLPPPLLLPEPLPLPLLLPEPLLLPLLLPLLPPLELPLHAAKISAAPTANQVSFRLRMLIGVPSVTRMLRSVRASLRWGYVLRARAVSLDHR